MERSFSLRKSKRFSSFTSMIFLALEKDSKWESFILVMALEILWRLTFRVGMDLGFGWEERDWSCFLTQEGRL